MAEGILKKSEGKRIRLAREISKAIKNNDRILVYGNFGAELSLMAKFVKEQGKVCEFFIPEARPYMYGSMIIARELKKAGIPVTVMSDNMAASIMQSGKITKVIAAARQSARNGDIAAATGTYQMALLAKYFKIPFYCLCPPALDKDTGDDITPRIRPQKELLEYNGLRLAPYGVKGYYPELDITPKQLIARHFTLNI